MAAVKTRYYRMPKGDDGKRHRVWRDIVDVKDILIGYYDDAEKYVVIADSPLLGSIKVIQVNPGETNV